MIQRFFYLITVILFFLIINTKLFAKKSAIIPLSDNKISLVKKIQYIIEKIHMDKARGILTPSDQIKINDRARSIIVVNMTVSFIVAVKLVSRFLSTQQPNGLFDLMFESVKIGSVISLLVMLSYHLMLPLTASFVKLSYDLQGDFTKSTNIDVLTNFLQQWDVLKQYTPDLLQPLFDELYIEYVTQGGNLSLTEEDATGLIKQLVAESMQLSLHDLQKTEN